MAITAATSGNSSSGAVSSIGLGSGIDVEAVIAGLKKVETAQLKPLAAAATLTNSRISEYASLKSMMSTLSDAATKLADSTGSGLWGTINAVSDNSAAVSVTATSTAASGTYDVTVSQLARAQTVASSAMATGTKPGAGTLTFTLGTYATGSDGRATGFTAGAAQALSVSVGAGDDLATIAGKINDASAGVTASVITDSAGQRLVFRSATTGKEAGFQVGASGDAGIQALAFDATASGSAFQLGQDTMATVNGIAVTSATKTFSGVIPGVSMTVGQVTTAPVGVNVTKDTAGMTKAIQTFVDAYNALTTELVSSTKYNSETKTAGTLQADTTAINMRNTLRSMVTSGVGGGVLSRLTDIGITTTKEGLLTVDSAKLAAAMTKPDQVKALFTANTGDAATGGIAYKMKQVARSMLAFDGTLATKTNSLNKLLDNNADNQTRVNNRWSAQEGRLRATYTALDAKMATLTALNAYIGQQVTSWNKSTG